MPRRYSVVGVRASDDEREQALTRLSDGAATGRLTLEELGQRVEHVQLATTREELATLTSDLPAERTSGGVVAARRSWAVGLFGGARRRPAELGEELVALAAFGGAQIDLSDARLTARTPTVTACAAFGGVEVLVPEGVEVEVRGIGLFGGFGGRGLEPAPPGAPRIIVRGLALFGGVEVRRSRREA